jgi:hypothetical protein
VSFLFFIFWKSTYPCGQEIFQGLHCEVLYPSAVCGEV